MTEGSEAPTPISIEQSRRLSREQSNTGPSLDHVMHNASRDLYPLMILFQTLTPFKDTHEGREPAEKSCDTRRDFLDSFAYICDVEKGGATVTATALEKLEQGNLLWLAANEGIRDAIKRYAIAVLLRLQSIDETNVDAVQEEILQLVVQQCSLRIKYYRFGMQKHARNCRMQLRSAQRDETVRGLRTKLKRLSEPPPSMTPMDLVRICYEMRQSEELADLRARSRGPKDEYAQLVHYIGRLGATYSCVRKLAKSMVELPSLYKIADVRTVEAPGIREVVVDKVDTSPYEILWKICGQSPAREPMDIWDAFHGLVNLDFMSNGQIHKSAYGQRTLKTRVHAELQIADRFGRDARMRFLGDDKYIGCSKPACYFCYTWLRSHKYGYVLPATHQKIIAECRGADLGLNQPGTSFIAEMYKKLATRVGADFLEFILRSQHEVVGIKDQNMSTEGSSRAPSRMPLTRLHNA